MADDAQQRSSISVNTDADADAFVSKWQGGRKQGLEALSEALSTRVSRRSRSAEPEAAVAE
ncbi:hypothetical protein [Novilysobacter antarcticus]|uniref:hypothetical protein n=1 Tax=Novilysobacter antarcticus TaxID=2862543 RepID=UPI001C995CD2|nr:hypothetical protein [Lysobacter antarcticus]